MKPCLAKARQGFFVGQRPCYKEETLSKETFERV